MINPYSAVWPAIGANGKFLPFVTITGLNGNTTYPFNPINAFPGPFVSQLSNIVNFGVDICKAFFINTEAQLQVKGKVVSSIFYESPNMTWSRNMSTQLYNTSVISITNEELILN